MNRYFGLHTLEGEWHALLPRYMLLADRSRGRRILDIGCGTGLGSSLLLELGAEMVDAIDHRPEVLELGRMKHAKDGLDFHVMFWEELDFPNDTFDMVLCLDPTSPVTDPSLIQEVRRVLKPGGEYVCAVERKTLEGFEGLLPRYGYTEAAESIDINQHTDRVPQIGVLEEQFESVNSIVQRPVFGFVFDVHTDGEDEDAPQQVRKESDDGSGIWVEDSTAIEDNGRWIPVDMGLCSHDIEAGSVELYFCGGAETPAPPLREIHMPYYSIVERLRQVVGDLQEMQVREGGDEESIFEEVVDGEEVSEPYTSERRPTNEFKAVSWDDEPTTIRSRPDFDAIPARRDDEVDDLSLQVNQLTSAYQQAHDDFQRMVQDASAALQERDTYIEHLVARIYDWESRFVDAQTNPTGAQPAQRIEELEVELARLRDQELRRSADQNEKAQLLDDETEEEKRETNELDAVSDASDPALDEAIEAEGDAEVEDEDVAEDES